MYSLAVPFLPLDMRGIFRMPDWGPVTGGSLRSSPRGGRDRPLEPHSCAVVETLIRRSRRHRHGSEHVDIPGAADRRRGESHLAQASSTTPRSITIPPPLLNIRSDRLSWPLSRCSDASADGRRGGEPRHRGRDRTRRHGRRRRRTRGQFLCSITSSWRHVILPSSRDMASRRRRVPNLEAMAHT